MIRIAGKTFDCPINYFAGEQNADIEITLPTDVKLTDDEILSLKNATLLEELEVNYGEVKGVLGSYNLVGWKAVENTWNGIRFRWQTYRTTDLEALKQENEDLTQALLELAEIVGGGNG